MSAGPFMLLSEAGRASAVFSSCNAYRYDLLRYLNSGPRYVNFVMLNPSTADAFRTDPTTTRCLNFARSWGYDGMALTNLFAYRATKPRDLLKASDPVGPENDEWLRHHAARAALVVVAWGAHRAATSVRVHEVREIFASLGVTPHALASTKTGKPQHPLFVPGSAEPIVWP